MCTVASPQWVVASCWQTDQLICSVAVVLHDVLVPVCVCRVVSDSWNTPEWHLADEKGKSGSVSEDDAISRHSAGINGHCTRWRCLHGWLKRGGKKQERVKLENSYVLLYKCYWNFLLCKCAQLILSVFIMHQIWVVTYSCKGAIV